MTRLLILGCGEFAGEALDIAEAAGTSLENLCRRQAFHDDFTWFAVPGMYGGFNYRLERREVELQLVAESWCRVVDGSGMRHVVTAKQAVLVDEGFV